MAPKGFAIIDNVIIGDEPKYVETRGIAQILWESLSKAPNFVSHINADSGEETTFAEIKERSVRCALWLKKQGVGKDDVISISTSNQLDNLTVCVATLFVGGIFYPWYSEWTEAEQRIFSQRIPPKVLFVSEQSIDRLAPITEGLTSKLVVLEDVSHPKYPSLKHLSDEQTADEVASFQYTVPNDPKNQCALIVLSSGSTGIPKGAMLSYKSLSQCTKRYPHRPLKRYLWYSPMIWINGCHLPLTGIIIQATRILHSKFDPEETSKVIEKYKINVLWWSPFMLTRCCKAKTFERYDYMSVSDLMLAGSKSVTKFLEEAQRLLPNCFVKNSYGMTELAGLAIEQTPERKRIDAIGFVVAGVKIKVVDVESGGALGPNQQGELWIYRPNHFMKYYGNPEETAKTIDKDGWLHTGDAAYYDEDGEIMITERIKQFIITRNEHVVPSEIEETLMGHPDVKECAVVAVPHDVDTERPFAFVVKTQPDAKVTEEELVELSSTRNEYNRLTGGIAFVDKIIYTSTGKKNLRLLKEKAKEYVSST